RQRRPTRQWWIANPIGAMIVDDLALTLIDSGINLNCESHENHELDDRDVNAYISTESTEQSLNKGKVTRPDRKINIDAPETYSFYDAYQHPTKASDWKYSIKDEMKSLMDMEVFDLVEKPEETDAVSSKWVFKHKLNPDGTIARYIN